MAQGRFRKFSWQIKQGAEWRGFLLSLSADVRGEAANDSFRLTAEVCERTLYGASVSADHHDQPSHRDEPAGIATLCRASLASLSLSAVTQRYAPSVSFPAI